MIAPPNVYAGERDNEACYRWISNMKIYLQGYTIFNPSISEQQQVVLVSSFLRDAALEFWRYRTGHKVDEKVSRIPVDLSTAFDLLAEYFSPSNDERTERWDTLCQVGSVSKLAETCCILHNVIVPTMSQVQLKDKFWATLDASIVSLIEETQYLPIKDLSFEQLVRAALKAESIANRNGGSASAPNSSASSLHAATLTQVALETRSARIDGLPTSVAQPVAIHHDQVHNNDFDQAALVATLMARLADNHRERDSSSPALSFNTFAKEVPPTTKVQPPPKRRMDFSQMPKKNSSQWKPYCYARNACLSCGGLTHTKLTCPDRKD